MVDRPSKWQQTWNILSPYVTEPINAMQRLMTTPYEVLVGGPSPAFDQAVADSLALSGTVTGGSAMIPKPRNAMAMGIKAFHGSPHSFNKFDVSKIGTGEGAQAYGHGLYFAENEGVAQGYKKALAYGRGSSPEDIAARAISATGDRESAIAELQRRLDDVQRRLITNPDSVPPEFKSGDNNLSKAIDFLKNGGDPMGSMYEVDINADPNAFLDWDKPLSEQPANVQTALSPWADPTDTQTTGELIKYLSKTEGDPAEISGILREAGIPGIKYLDAGSRGGNTMWVVTDKAGKPLSHELDQASAQKAFERLTRDFGYEGMQIRPPVEGTRNYVVFDDRLISIVRKYGIAGASAYLGYDILKNVSEAQAEELRKIEKGVK